MLRRLRNLLQSNKLSKDIEEELDFHQLQTHGSFGNRTQIAERAREASILLWLETLWQDVRYGARQLRKSPLLVTVAVLSLALGIGANTAIFTLIKSVMLQNLPVPKPGRLVLFYDETDTGVYSGDTPSSTMFSVPFANYLQAHNTVFEKLCAFRQETDRVTMIAGSSSEPSSFERVRAHLVSGTYFDTFGVSAAIGRLLRPEDDRPGAPPVAILSHSFWRTRFRGDQKVVGHTVTLSGGVFTVAGVVEQGFFGERMERAPEFWVPLSFQPQITRQKSWLEDQNIYFLNMLGRLKPGVSRAQAQAAVTTRLRQYYRDRLGSAPKKEALRKVNTLQPILKPGGSGISGLRHRFAEPLRILMAVVSLVLLIACANIATLLLARDAVRQPEFLARLALGASPTRLIRQVLTESLLLSLLGGVLSTGFAWISARLLVLALHVDSVVKVKPDIAVLTFTFVVTLTTGLLFGSLPAFRSSRIDLRPTSGLARKSPVTGASSLIALQVALSVMLLVCSGLLVRSFSLLVTQDMGFRKDNLLIIQTDPRLAGYKDDELFPLYRELDARLNSIAGVRSATVARYTPISGNTSKDKFSLEGYTPQTGVPTNVEDAEVAPRFFNTLNIPLLLGRVIDERDLPSSEIVTVVNDAFAKKYLRGQNPVGRRITLDSSFRPPGAKIVGVVANSKFHDLRDEAKPMAYFSLWQRGLDPTLLYARDLVLRTNDSPLALAATVRSVLKSIDSRLPIFRTLTMSEQIDSSLEQQRLLASLCSIFGMIASLLAAIGIYGTLAYSVARRKPEIGIRMAIGAQRRHVLWMMLRESFAVIAVGLAVGFALAFWAGSAIRSYLYEVTVADLPSVSGALLAIVILILLAAYLPARRATAVDPASVLRYE